MAIHSRQLLQPNSSEFGVHKLTPPHTRETPPSTTPHTHHTHTHTHTHTLSLSLSLSLSTKPSRARVTEPGVHLPVPHSSASDGAWGSLARAPQQPPGLADSTSRDGVAGGCSGPTPVTAKEPSPTALASTLAVPCTRPNGPECLTASRDAAG